MNWIKEHKLLVAGLAILLVILVVGLVMHKSVSKPSPFATGDQTLTYTQPLTITGLPTGCTATISGTIITVSGCPVAPVPVPTETLTVDATSPAPVSAGPVLIGPTQDPPVPALGVGGNKLTFKTVGQNYEYSVNVPVAGSYVIMARICTEASSTGGALTVHWEMPAGTVVSSPLTVPSPVQWQNVSSTQAVTLTAGVNKLRLVVDALPTGAPNNPAYFHYFQLTPGGSTPPPVAHSVKLTWTAGAATNPPCPPQNCPWPTGSTCYGTTESFNVYRSQTSGTYGAPLASVLAPTTTYTDTAVQAGQTYYYKVTGYGQACTPESAAVSEVKVTIPSTRSLK